MRIDILVSVLPKGINDLEVGVEEHNLKNAIGKLLADQGYKFVVAGSEIVNEGTKKKVVLD